MQTACLYSDKKKIAIGKRVDDKFLSNTKFISHRWTCQARTYAESLVGFSRKQGQFYSVKYSKKKVIIFQMVNELKSWEINNEH